MENDFEERIIKLNKRVSNLEAFKEFLEQRISICGSVPDVNDYVGVYDFCTLSFGHKGLHCNLLGYKWGFENPQNKKED
jgi:hypothetical protein